VLLCLRRSSADCRKDGNAPDVDNKVKDDREARGVAGRKESEW